MKKKIALLLVCALCVVSLAACGGSAEPTGEAEPAPQVTEAPEAAPAEEPETEGLRVEAGGAVFERTADDHFIFTDVDGRVTELEEYPQRIACDSAATPHFFDLFGKDLVGIPETNTALPQRYADVPTIGRAGSPNFEVIKSADIDLIVSTIQMKEGVVEQYEEFGIPVIFLKLRSAEDARNAVTMVGAMFGDPAEAAEIVADFQAREEAILAKAQAQEPRRVVLLYTTYPREAGFYCMSEDSYVGGMLEMMGGINITSTLSETMPGNSSQYLFSGENITTFNPEVVMRLTNGMTEENIEAFTEEFSTQPYWALTDAVKNGKVFDVDPTLSRLCTPRYIDMMETIYTYLYE